MFPKVFSELLPKAIRPRPLSQLCTTQVSTSCKSSEEIPDFLNKIKRTLMVPNLAQGMALVVKSVAVRDKERVGSIFLEYTTKFLDSLEIHCVKPLKIDLFLKDDETETKIATESVWCYIEERQQSYHFYVHHGIRSYSISDAHNLIAKQLLSCLQDTEINLSNLQFFLAKILRSNTTEDVYNFLQEHQISSSKLTHKVDIDHELILGAPIPTSLHFRLDQSSQNIFQPQEFVAYQPIDEEQRVIVAMVSHVVSLKDGSGKPLKPMNMEYKIITSQDDQDRNTKRVKAIEIYKFVRGETAPQEAPPDESECQELVRFEGSSDEVPPPASVTTNTPAPIDVKQAKDEVREELEEIWRLPKGERKRAIHRLYLKWHPDKNPHNQDAAEEVFKFLLQELDRLERGAGPSVANESGTYSSWRNFQHFWDNTARQHRQYHDEYKQFRGGARQQHHQRHRGGRGQYFFDEEYTPPRREREGQQWVRQALADNKALKTLLQEARIDTMMSCHVCFLAHEVAEKALKGAMHTTCGLREELRENHNIIPLAHAIEQVKPEEAKGLSALAQPLEPTYYEDTRFPKQSLSSSPCDKFTLQNAEEAEKCAAGILKIVQDTVET